MPHEEQNYSNHTRIDPPFHFFVLPVFAIVLIATIVELIMHPGLHSAVHVIVMLAVAVAVTKIRTNSLKVQDRVIRLEESLRLATLPDPSLRSRISELTVPQLIALRFASDAELPALAARALNEKLSSKEIKQSIQNWRADNLRV